MMTTKKYGLVGKDIDYSFSKQYFTQKFEKESNECSYQNFDIPDIIHFPEIIRNEKNLCGLNITIPYKEKIFPYLDKLSVKAQKIGAVNCIRFTKKSKIKGYNTDCYGFKKSLKPLLKRHHTKALILGTGGASKAVAYVLKNLNIEYLYVSRNPQKNILGYEEINAKIINNHTIIINCTPLGTYPDIENFPPLPYQYLNQNHIAFDLIYNPEKTQFLQKASENGATIKNGYEMLVYQAEKAWEIWNK